MICTVYTLNQNCAGAGRVVPGSAIEYTDHEERDLCDDLADHGDYTAHVFSSWDSMREHYESMLEFAVHDSNAMYRRRVAKNILAEIESL